MAIRKIINEHHAKVKNLTCDLVRYKADSKPFATMFVGLSLLGVIRLSHKIVISATAPLRLFGHGHSCSEPLKIGENLCNQRHAVDRFYLSTLATRHEYLAMLGREIGFHVPLDYLTCPFVGY